MFSESKGINNQQSISTIKVNTLQGGLTYTLNEDDTLISGYNSRKRYFLLHMIYRMTDIEP